MGEVVRLPTSRQVFTPKTSVFHALRVYGAARLSELTARLVTLAQNTPNQPGPIVPPISPNEVTRSLEWLNKRGFVRFDRRTRTWSTTAGSDVPARWRDTYQ